MQDQTSAVFVPSQDSTK